MKKLGGSRYEGIEVKNGNKDIGTLEKGRVIAP